MISFPSIASNTYALCCLGKSNRLYAAGHEDGFDKSANLIHGGYFVSHLERERLLAQSID